MNEISLLFAIEAEQLMRSGKAGEAIKLCKIGLETYPEYSSAYSILAESYYLTGKFKLALGSIEKALTFNPNSSQLVTLKTAITHKLENLPEQYSDLENDDIDEYSLNSNFQIESDDLNLPEFSDNIQIHPDDEISEEILDNEYNEESDNIVEIPAFSIDNKNFRDSGSLGTEEIIEAEANSKSEIRANNIGLIPGLYKSPLIKNGKIPEEIKPVCNKDPFDVNFIIPRRNKNLTGNYLNSEKFSLNHQSDKTTKIGTTEPEKGIVSETLAAIYESQEAYPAAIAAYYELLELHPERSGFFNKKIEELSLKLK